MRIALIGNPNCGKTTLFNELTGANQHVGNWPGVTVEKKSGHIKQAYGKGEIIDLPGIYSLSPFSMEEVVSREFLIEEAPEVVLNIVDATNLERNLYLTIQLIELNAPVVVALNMMDEITDAGYKIDTARLSHDLGVPVVPISATKRTGIKELVKTLTAAKPPKRHELPSGPLERLIALVEGKLVDHTEHEHSIGDAQADTYPLHWAAIKVLEGDELVIGHLTLDDKTNDQIADLKLEFEAEHGLVTSVFASARYELIHRMIYHGLTVWSKDGSHHHHVKHAPQDFHLQMTEHDNNEPLFSVPHFGKEGEDEAISAASLIEIDELPEGWADISLPGKNALSKDESGKNALSKDALAEDVSGDYRDASKASIAKTDVLKSKSEADTSFDSFARSDKIDKVLTHKIWAIPIFLLVIYAVFHLTFADNLLFATDLPSPGVWLQSLTENGIAAFTDVFATLFEEGSWAESLVIGGVIGGVGSVLGFVPQILLLFLCLSLLEDCGYMARAAFIMDRFLRRFGLSGKSFVPMLMGFGCTVPAAMAARTMENENDRRLTLMLVPFMSCGARAPIFFVLSGAFFSAYADLIVFAMYLLGILVAILSGILLRKLIFKGALTAFVIELPRYRTPRLRTTLLGLWEKLRGYLVRAGTIIFAMSVVLWVLSSFGIVNGSFNAVDIDQSLLAAFGNLIAPIFTPLGFGTWMAAVAILTGFIAKEAVVGTLGTLVGVGEDAALEGGLSGNVLSTAMGLSPLAAMSLMVFCLLYIPCIAAFATLKKEFGSWKWAIGQAVYMVAVAYLMSFAVFGIGSLIVG